MSGASSRPGDLGARFVELFVLAPLGAGVRLASDLPQAVSRARQELSNARFIGRMVVEQGASKLAQRPAGSPERDAPVATEPAVERDEVGGDGVGDDTVNGDTVNGDTGAVADARLDERGDAEASQHLDAVDLAIPDYDHLPALDIIGQLDRLSSDERAEVERYERAHRGRRTVLGKIAQLDATA